MCIEYLLVGVNDGSVVDSDKIRLDEGLQEKVDKGPEHNNRHVHEFEGG